MKEGMAEDLPSNAGPESSQPPPSRGLGGFFGGLPPPPEAPPIGTPEEGEEPREEGAILPEVGVTAPGWWDEKIGNWEKVDADPKERLLKGSAMAVLYYDEALRYTDEARDQGSGQVLGRESENWKSMYANYEQAVAAFERHAEQNRLYRRDARIVQMVEDFRAAEDQALAGKDPQIRLDIYEHDRLTKELDFLNDHGVGVGNPRHQLYSQEQWDRAVERKQEVEKRIEQLTGEINGEIDPTYLGKRDDLRGGIERAKKLVEIEKLKEAEEDKLEEEADWEKRLGEPQLPAGYNAFNNVLVTRRRQELLRGKAGLIAQRDAERQRVINREIARGRDPRDIRIDEVDGLPPELINELDHFGIDLDAVEEYDEARKVEADKAADRFLIEAERADAFGNLIQPIINECISLAELVAEHPEQFLQMDLARQGEGIANAQSNGPYAGERGEYVRRAFRNIQALVNEIITRKETGISSLESPAKVDTATLEPTPGINWAEIRDTLIEGKKWYTQSEFGTFTFNDQSAVTLRLGVAQFRYDILHGSNYYDQQQMLGDMQAFTKALRIVNIEKLAKREGWTREKAIAFRDSLRHEGENGISLTLMKFWGDCVMMPQMNGFYADYWAKEGPGRLEDLLKAHDGYKALATRFLRTKYGMIYNLEGYTGLLLGKTQVQGALMEADKKLLAEEMMQWELVGVPGPRRDRLIELRARAKAEEKLNPDEQKELIDFETKAREDLTTCQSEDELMDRFQKRDVNLQEIMLQAKDAYEKKKKDLGTRAEQVDGKLVIKDKAEDGNILPPEQQKEQIDRLKQLRKAYVEAKQRYDQVKQTATEGVELALQVDHVFGEAYELGPRKVRMENGDLISIMDIDKALRYAAMEEAQQTFKEKYGFKDNLALLRERAASWNGDYAEYKAILGFWKYLDDLSNKRGGLNRMQAEWADLYRQVDKDMKSILQTLLPNAAHQLALKVEEGHPQVTIVSSKSIGSPYQRILQMIPPQAIESFVTVDVTMDENKDENNPASKKTAKHFDLAKGYEYTGLTAEQLPFVMRAWDQLNKDGFNTTIGGRKFRDIKNMTELESVESFFLGRYAGTREGQDSQDAILGGLTGELPWLNKNRHKLAKTGRRGFIGSESLQGTPQQRNNQYIRAVGDTVYFDRVMSILAYQLATTDAQGKFSPDKLSTGVPWNGTWGGNIEFDYPGYGLTNIRRIIGRFPKILRGAPIREPSLARYIGFNGLHEAVGNKAFSPTDPWVFETWGKIKDAGQKFQSAYISVFNPEDLQLRFGGSDKLLNDADNLRVTGQHLISQWGVHKAAHLIARIMLSGQVLLNGEPKEAKAENEQSLLNPAQEEEMVQAGIERWMRITSQLGPIAASYQHLRGAEDAGLGLEMNDLYHNSMILPVLLSEGEGAERWQQGGLDAYDTAVPMFAALTVPWGWFGRDNFIGHEYRKIRPGRNSGAAKSTVLVRVN
ncbi:hypothetical protein A3B45_02715 [Candidatus Daviesbacteria bacterium RIFCSPLOWO2_01_FULL_39_12]|uniref:Uncharacterized protein n=1 Tax=Candidatus Daviesbacteria bacterium RIFCSPLOWO2_01_FULL_39_12 TaxID=1797785 RepID=A0A1F5KSK8_9BACT|nr:MAG: hypothetical protein A3B45_02715 [Candidatus Daviesbacteria bacterium RIFCSPLOWO2_01_FULL_39_12]